MALFEGHTEPGSFSNRLNTILGGQNVSSDQVNDSGAPDGAGGLAGILNTGHDRPYRFSFYSNALSATIHAKSLSELPAEGQSPVPGTGDAKGSSDQTHKLGAQKSTSAVSTVPADSDVTTWWLDIQNPTEEEMKMLGKARCPLVFSIHPLTTEDILMEETREKIELFRNYYLVCFRSFDQDLYSPTHLEPLNMYIIVFREGTLSFHFRSTPHPQNVRRRIKQLKDYISVTSDWISYALIDDITDAFGPLIQSIEYEVDSIDELVLILKETTEQSDMLRRIGTCRKKVMGLLRLMGNKADVVKGLAKRCNENWRVAPTSDIGLYLSDIQDHLITMTQNLNHYEKILSRSHSNYLAQISIEMTDANNQINDVLSKLTALGTILIPMNLVTGLWGMNVHVPGQDITEGYVWFGAIIAALVAFAIIGGYSTYKFMVNR
ncbi:cora-domain-containing protein [Fistulina hepatica ATCC 64428]|uniref:Cora-domain-containing protein n=1 Tax=Fistulina hepatica ATCC 64428 TaxID=1128425 RepID=A0A0D7AL69_9AGAR|nr:cora-domain-containing protein [Fistulina hepatica ATCC 64428]